MELVEFPEADNNEWVYARIKGITNEKDQELQKIVTQKVAHIPEVWDDEGWSSDDWVDNTLWRGTPQPVAEPILSRMQDVKPTSVEWLWQYRIPLGALSILDGDPGIGKSTITMDIAARLTEGRRMPDGAPTPAGPGNVLLVGAEDALSYTVRPRLEAAGADLSRVYALTGVSDTGQHGGRSLSFPSDLSLLERAVLNTQAKLVIIDPIMAYLGSEVNSSSDQEVRRVLSPLARVAESTGASILMVRHLRKTNDGPALYQGGGSIGIVGAARAGLIVVRDPQDPTESMCILKQSKTNLGPWPRPIGYSLRGLGPDSAATVAWSR